MLLKTLFVGEIIPFTDLKLQGVGGTVNAIDYGTIRVNIHDDEGIKHTFTIYNVLYVPDAPMNLLSPQKWIAGLPDAERLTRGAMMITMDDITMLLWGKRRFLTTIHHRLSIGLPIIAVNDALTVKKTTSAFDYPICQPCLPPYMHTSVRVHRVS